MKTRTLAFVPLCVLACLPLPAVAQITITAADVSAQLTVSYVLTNNSDTLTVSANIGSPGATSWNFSALNTHTIQTLTSVLVSSTPYASDYPSATHALQTPVVVSGISGTGYQYLALGTHLLNPGNKAGGPFPPFGTGTATTTNSPVDTTYALPSTFGSSWNSAFTSTQVIAINGVPILTTPTAHNISYSVDAYGLMTIPGGGIHDALRIRKVEKAGTKTVGYIFLAKNGASVQLTAADTLQANSGVIQLQAKSVTWSPPNPALPVQIVSFAAALDPTGSRVLLEWTTESEVNNFGFEVQKGRAAMGEFQTIPDGFVPGHGTTLARQHYSSVDRVPTPGVWYYRLNQLDLNGSSHPNEPVRVDFPTGVNDRVIPAEFSLSQNFPNPFNPSTVIRYGLAQKSAVRLEVYNALGQLITTLVNQEQEAGSHEVRFDASGLSSGAYFYTLRAGGFLQTRTLLLVR